MIRNIFWIPGKGENKIASSQATLIKDKGMMNDYHAVGGDKQLIIITDELFNHLTEENGFCFAKFKPNLVVDEVLDDGYYQIGDSVIKVKRHLKKCFTECWINNKDACLMKNNIFEGCVQESGTIAIGDSLKYLGILK